MAGESPDKSEQQKSSGTARSEHDPRLAVFREPASRAESGDGVDTKTAVFRFGTSGVAVSAPGEPAGAGADGAVGAGGAEPEASAPEPDGEAGPTGAGADGAVGAGGAEPEAPAPEPDGEAGPTGAGADGAVGAGGAEPEAGETRSDEPVAADAESGGEVAGDADADSAEGADAASGAGAGAEGADAASDGGADAGADGGDADSDAAANSDADSDADGSEGPEGIAADAADLAGPAEEAPEGSEGSVEAPEAAPAAPEGAEESEEPAEGSEPAGTPAEEPVKAAAEPDEPEEGDARLRAAVAAWVSTADDEGKDGADEEGEGDGKAAASEPDASEPDASEPDASKPAASEAEPEAEAAASDDAPEEARVPHTREEPDAEKGADAETEADEETADVPESETVDATADQQGIDQPTAVFKAPRSLRVDQPTTALKITRPVAKPEPEAPAERTSKFVPLRADDVRPAPAPRGPEAPAPAPAASLSGAERTRQQPMPPRPPLDLLAELTNTPPPPETPVRTVVRRVKIWTPLVLLLLIAFAIVQMVRPLPDPALTMSAKETYSFDGKTPTLPWPGEGQGYMAATGLGKVGSFGEQKPVPIASVAKAMTAYLVLKDHPLKRGQDGPGIEIDAKAESDGQLFSEGESTLDTVKKGDILTERDALAALMIPSANNIARLLARWDAGSEKAFVEKMNRTAAELGMKNTHYTDPSGLTASTVSTAEDLVKLGEKLVEFPALMDITKLPEWKDPSGKKWRNYNTLVPFDGALGIKTGSTTKAGGNLLFAAHKMVDGTDQLIVGAVLGQHTNPIIDTVNAASKQVMVATLDLLEGAKIVKKGDVVGTVDNGMGGSSQVVATKDVKAVGWAGLTVKLELTDDGKTIPHGAVAGTHVGTLTVGEGASQVKVAVALKNDLPEPTTGDKLTRLG